AIFTLIVVSQNGGGGRGGHPRHMSFGAGQAHHHLHRHPQPRHHHGAARHHRERHRHHHHHAAHRGGLIASRCSYHAPSSGGCGSVPPPDSCGLRDNGALQDRSCTPGAIDPHVTQADIHSTICVSG